MIIKKLENSYTHIPNEIITDPEVGDKALRIYCYMMSKPDEWTFFRGDIKRQLGIGSDSTVAKAMKELVDAGWITREKVDPATAVARGLKPGTYIYTIYDIKQKSQDLQSCTNYNNGKSGTHNKTNITNKTDFVSNTPQPPEGEVNGERASTADEVFSPKQQSPADEGIKTHNVSSKNKTSEAEKERVMPAADKLRIIQAEAIASGAKGRLAQKDRVEALKHCEKISDPHAFLDAFRSQLRSEGKYAKRLINFMADYVAGGNDEPEMILW